MSEGTEREQSPECRFTGWYAVVCFGKDEKGGVPCYLMKIPYTDSKGEEHITYKDFTYNLMEAALFTDTYNADFARQEVEKVLAEKKHCFAGQVKVMEIRGLVREFGKEE